MEPARMKDRACMTPEEQVRYSLLALALVTCDLLLAPCCLFLAPCRWLLAAGYLLRAACWLLLL